MKLSKYILHQGSAWALITVSSIVFVHGLNGHPNSTWRHSTTGFLWPRELVTQVPGARILLYGYVNAELRDSDHIRIRGLAERFLSDLVNERHKEDVSMISASQRGGID
jgi:hypothetical protein